MSTGLVCKGSYALGTACGECERCLGELKTPSNTETPSPMGEPRVLSQEVALLRAQVQQLCAAVRGLVQLQSVLNQAVQQLLKRDGGANFDVI